MRLLLDTHIALWAVIDDPRLSAKARALILDPANEIVVSAASIWEIAIKHALRREDMQVSGQEALEIFVAAGFNLLAIAPTHAAQVDALPSIHQDPFDRILVAQAMVEQLRLMSHDSTVAHYGPVVERV